MDVIMFVNRERETERMQAAFQREKPQLIVVYGRRRCGKSTLLHHVLPTDAIYFSADLRESPLQISALATEIDQAFPGFAKPAYPGWESLLTSFNTVLKSRMTLCIDEFPYLVKNNTDLPSVIQKLVDRLKERNFHLVLCGSSQQMMHSMVLHSASPLYGRCDEIIRIRPMSIRDMRDYLSLNSVEAVREFGVWGGIPRYWEIRSQAAGFSEAVKKSILDQNGILYEEPERLFSDELRTASQTFSILSLIGSGAPGIRDCRQVGKTGYTVIPPVRFSDKPGIYPQGIALWRISQIIQKKLVQTGRSFSEFLFHVSGPQ